MSIKLEDVFGVSSRSIKSYVQREKVEKRFSSALNSRKQIVVYGASKQGKTVLVKNHFPYEENIVINMNPQTQLTDIYQSILRQAKIPLLISYTEGTGKKSKGSAKARIKCAIAFFGSASASASVEEATSTDKALSYEQVPFNLSLPQDISELLLKTENKKQIILENFHYLSDDKQKTFAFDLRTFQDLNIRFIILGVWREKNRLSQFNGDLVDRVEEVTVEPWVEKDILRIVEKGSEVLNIKIGKKIVDKAWKSSFDNVGIFQELIKETCLNAGIKVAPKKPVTVSTENCFLKAIENKTVNYSTRHERVLETIAAGNDIDDDADKPPFLLYYYLVRVLLDIGYKGIKKGIPIASLLSKIKAVHHHSSELELRHLGEALCGIAEFQSMKSINPPVLAYDRSTRCLHVVDSTFFYFLKNQKLHLIKELLPNPLDSWN